MGTVTGVAGLLKKIFIDVPIEIIKKIHFWCFNVIGMYLSFLYIPYHYLYVLPHLRIGNDGRVGIMQVNSYVVPGCNLRCEFCAAFSAYQKGIFSADELIASYVEWRKKIKPQFFVLSGGEPLLHPELERIVRESAKIWNDSKLWLGTNGLLLERLKPEILQALRETGFTLFVTEHTFDPEHHKKLEAGCNRLKREKIPFFVRPSRQIWAERYRYKMGKSEEGEREQIVPFNSNPKKAFFNPGNFCYCPSIRGDELYKCGYLCSVSRLVSGGALNADNWKAALSYVPLTLRSSSAEILEHLRRSGIPECTVCPGSNHIVPARQLSVQNRIRVKL